MASRGKTRSNFLYCGTLFALTFLRHIVLLSRSALSVCGIKSKKLAGSEVSYMKFAICSICSTVNENNEQEYFVRRDRIGKEVAPPETTLRRFGLAC